MREWDPRGRPGLRAEVRALLGEDWSGGGFVFLLGGGGGARVLDLYAGTGSPGR